MSKIGGTNIQKSQAKATIFLVLFMILVPTALALGSASELTGNGIADPNAIQNEAPAIQSAEIIPTEPQPALEPPTPEQATESQQSLSEPPSGAQGPAESTITQADDARDTGPIAGSAGDVGPADTQDQEQEHPESGTADGSDSSDMPTKEQSNQEPQETGSGVDLTPIDLCEAVTCSPSFRVCPDEFNATCNNVCDPATGVCTDCQPDCSGHEALDPEPDAGPGTGEGPGPDITNCTESWDCSIWSDCVDGTQTRSCSDQNSCGTEADRPGLEQGCQEPPANVTGNEPAASGNGTVNWTETPPANGTVKPPANVTPPVNVTEPCDLACGECQILNETVCSCSDIANCTTNLPECITDAECAISSDQCTSVYCNNGSCDYKALSPCCGNDICEDGEASDCPDCKDIEPQPEPGFDISIQTPDRVRRGTTIELSATITNTGEGAAGYLKPYWLMPEGLELLATDSDCETLVPGTACTVTGKVYVRPEAIGIKELRLLLDYA